MSQIVFTRRAAARVRDDLKATVQRELASIFSRGQVVLVQESLEGYSRDQERKLILAVEVHSEVKPPAGPGHTDYACHVVKLGQTQVVTDRKNWEQCLGTSSIVSHVFLPLEHHDLPDGRAAVVYADARQQSGEDSEGGGIRTLESAARQSIKGRGIRLESIERVIGQVYSELENCLYSDATEHLARTRDFYRSKLKLADGEEATFQRWTTGELLRLRKEAAWLFCGAYKPSRLTAHSYIDPFDYVSWSLGAQGELPRTLVGRSHGDLHGRNVLVVIRLDEAERPTVIDYDDMGASNVLAWDFVKLEMELKASLLVPLFHQADVRERLLATAAEAVEHKEALGHVLRAWKLPTSRDEPAGHLRGLLCLYLFETALAKFTRELSQTHRPEQIEPPALERLTGIPELDNLLLLLLSIRRQAACVLGGLSARKNPPDWFDEYHFALAVYGLSTAKYITYDVYQRAAALVSSGVAVGQLSSVPGQLSRFRRDDAPMPMATYQASLNNAYALWAQKGKSDLGAAKAIFERGKERFGYVVPFVREHALVLASCNELTEARKVLEDLVAPASSGRDRLEALAQECCQFGDFETLSRIGRIFKNHGDQDWASSQLRFADLGSSTARQAYRTSCLFYKTAFAISQDYFPGENAAVTALLAGEGLEAKEIAARVLHICAQVTLSCSREDFWLFCTEGTLSLLTEGTAAARGFFKKALEVFKREGKPAGMLQSTYETLCRLYEALGRTVVDPVARLLLNAGANLDPGPLTDCGGASRRTRQRKADKLPDSASSSDSTSETESA